MIITSDQIPQLSLLIDDGGAGRDQISAIARALMAGALSLAPIYTSDIYEELKEYSELQEWLTKDEYELVVRFVKALGEYRGVL